LRSASLGFFLEQRHDLLPAELLAALEEAELEDEQVADQVAAELRDEVAGRGRGAACRWG